MNKKPLQRPSVTSLALACACAVGFTTAVQAQHDPVGTNQIALTDFDNFNPGWGYGYFYNWGTPSPEGTYTYTVRYEDPLLDPANGPLVYQYTFDTTGYSVAGAGCGTGFGTGVAGWSGDPAEFNSLDPADYIVSWDARVEGLLPGQTTANCELQFRLGPDGAGRILMKGYAYNPGSNWMHFVRTFEDGFYGEGTTYQTFTNGLATGFAGISFNQNQHEPYLQFGFDADNAIYVDNIKLEVIQYAGPPPPPPPKVALAVLDYNWDDKPIWWSWNAFPGGTGWVDGGGTRAYYWAINDAPDEGVAGSKAYVMAMDNSLMAGGTTPGWAGGNTGGGGPGNYAPMTSPDLKDYRLNFAARVDGLAEGREDTPVTVQLHFRAPDDTLQPPDGNSDMDVLLVLNVDVSGVKSNWQTFMPLLKMGSVNSGSVANFQTHHSQISQIDFQFQIQNSHQEAVWGYDADNRIVIDDFKLERLVTGTPPLVVQSLGDKVVVSWAMPDTGSVKLLKGSSITAVDTEVVGATSPYTNAVSVGPLYFRTLWVPPTP